MKCWVLAEPGGTPITSTHILLPHACAAWTCEPTGNLGSFLKWSATLGFERRTIAA